MRRITVTPDSIIFLALYGAFNLPPSDGNIRISYTLTL